MRTHLVSFGIVATLAVAAVCAVSQNSNEPGYRVKNRELSRAPDGVVHLSAARSDGIAWLEGAAIGEGRISLDVKGADLQGRSFVGVAFHGTDDGHYDVVYLRPFNFHAAEQLRRSHSIQYVSMPEFGWERLRNEFPGKYEMELQPAPDANAWVHLEVVLEGGEVSAFVDGASSPALRVKLLSRQAKGTVGLWVGDESDGDFRRLEVKPR